MSPRPESSRTQPAKWRNSRVENVADRNDDDPLAGAREDDVQQSARFGPRLSTLTEIVALTQDNDGRVRFAPFRLVKVHQLDRPGANH